jgi:hypothetical protein
VNNTRYDMTCFQFIDPGERKKKQIANPEVGG